MLVIFVPQSNPFLAQPNQKVTMAALATRKRMTIGMSSVLDNLLEHITDEHERMPYTRKTAVCVASAPLLVTTSLTQTFFAGVPKLLLQMRDDE